MKETSQMCSSVFLIPTVWPAKTVLRLIFRRLKQMRLQVGPRLRLRRRAQDGRGLMRRILTPPAGPIAGNVIVYRVGRCFSHGGIVVDEKHVLHAYYKTQSVIISPLHEVELAHLPNG